MLNKIFFLTILFSNATIMFSSEHNNHTTKLINSMWEKILLYNIDSRIMETVYYKAIKDNHNDNEFLQELGELRSCFGYPHYAFYHIDDCKFYNSFLENEGCTQKAIDYLISTNNINKPNQEKTLLDRYAQKFYYENKRRILSSHPVYTDENKQIINFMKKIHKNGGGFANKRLYQKVKNTFDEYCSEQNIEGHLKKFKYNEDKNEFLTICNQLEEVLSLMQESFSKLNN